MVRRNVGRLVKKIALSTKPGCRNAGRYSALVDDEDYDFLAAFRWSAYVVHRRAGLTQVYAGRKHLTGGRYILQLMHRVVWLRHFGNIPKNATIDHVSHSEHAGLDNRIGNLRLASKFEQQGNRRKSPLRSSRFKGVCWDKSRARWIAYIYIDDRRRHLGRFHSELEAACAYDVAAASYFGAFSKLNVPASVQ